MSGEAWPRGLERSTEQSNTNHRTFDHLHRSAFGQLCYQMCYAPNSQSHRSHICNPICLSIYIQPPDIRFTTSTHPSLIPFHRNHQPPSDNHSSQHASHQDRCLRLHLFPRLRLWPGRLRLPGQGHCRNAMHGRARLPLSRSGQLHDLHQMRGQRRWRNGQSLRC
jgi:hypothetical protein